MKQTRFNPETAIRLSANGVAKTLNATLALFAVLDENGKPNVIAISSLTGQEAIVGKIFRDYKLSKYVIHLGERAVKTLFDKDISAGAKVLVEDYSEEQWRQAEAALISHATDAAKIEIAAIPAEIPVKIWVGTTSMSIYGAFQMDGKEKLSLHAKELIERDILLVSQKQAMKFEYEGDDEFDEFGKPKCTTTFGEFQKIVRDLRAEKDVNDALKKAARALKFEEAKATGKPVMLSSYVAQERDTPLRNDGEGDMVTCMEMAMPNGTVKMEYHHNY